MFVPLILLIASLMGPGAALIQPGLDDFILLAGPCTLACLILIARAPRRRIDDATTIQPLPPPRFRHSGRGRPKWILVDGSNVLHWKDNTPQIDTLRAVIAHLTDRGYSPRVVFDANAGYLIAGKYQHDKALSDLLGLPEDRVMVVQKGSPADPVLLAAARDLRARIVTNDRFRDWAEIHPEVRDPGFLVRGSVQEDGVRLDLVERVT